MIARSSVATIAALMLCLTACGDSDDDPSAVPTAVDTASAPAGLDGTSFVATSVTGRELVEDTELTVAFVDGNLAVRAGCNTMSGPYEVEDSTLRWAGPAASTMIACPGPLAAQDLWLADFFTNGADASVDENGLTLSDGEVTIELSPDGDR
jgi:heat shock protein HslJ